MKTAFSRLLLPLSCRPALLASAGVTLAGIVLGVSPVRAQNYVENFTNFDNNGLYADANNWDQLAVPDLTTANTAVIGDGVSVSYDPTTPNPNGGSYGDLIIKNGGILEVTSGGFTQITGNNYYQLNGNGTILVNGGTFTQGTASSTPFNVTGTGNAFTVTAGTVNISSSFNLNVGLTFAQSGGAINVTGNETDFNSSTATLSGGTLTTKLITGVNGGADQFNISGGVLNLTGGTAIYGGGTTQFINFTPGSNGEIRFTSGSMTVAGVQGEINSGAIEYNAGGAGTLADFNILQNGSEVDLTLVGSGSSVPEPSTFAMLGAGACAALAAARRRKN